MQVTKKSLALLMIEQDGSVDVISNVNGNTYHLSHDEGDALIKLILDWLEARSTQEGDDNES